MGFGCSSSYGRGGGGSFLRAFTIAARQNPIPALLIGAGCAMFMAEKTGLTQRLAARAKGGEGPFPRGAVPLGGERPAAGQSVRSAVGNATDAIRDQASSLAEGARDRAAAVGDTVSETAASVSDRIAGTVATVRDRVELRVNWQNVQALRFVLPGERYAGVFQSLTPPSFGQAHLSLPQALRAAARMTGVASLTR
jgi:hypothetical protein